MRICWLGMVSHIDHISVLTASGRRPSVQIAVEPNHSDEDQPRDPGMSVVPSVATQPPRSPSNLSGPLTMRYRATWTLIDRLEHAVRKTELMQWERNRLEENFRLRQHARRLNPDEVKVHMKRLILQLRKFGLSTHVSTTLAEHLYRGHSNDAGLRFPFFRQAKDRGFDSRCMDELSEEVGNPHCDADITDCSRSGCEELLLGDGLRMFLTMFCGNRYAVTLNC